MRHARAFVAILPVLCGALAESADFQVATNTAGYQGHRAGRAVSTDGAGNFVVVWDGGRYGYPGLSVLARRFDASAQPLGPDLLVTASASHREGAVAPWPCSRTTSTSTAWPSA
jgi:hypothetical protein